MAIKSTKNADAATEVQIEKLVYGGDGLARIDGQVLLAPFVLPGELVSVIPHPAKNGLLRGTDVAVLQAAPERVTPRCEYFGTCGGCDYQHASYEFQLAQKQAILRETLHRLGGIEYTGDIPVISGTEWEYRNRIQLHFADGQVGFNRAGSHDLCAVDHCPISSPKLNEVIAKLAWAAKQPQWPKFLQSLEVFTNESDVQLNVVDTTRPIAARFFEWCATWLQGLARNELSYPVNEFTFRISRGSFFQVNRFLLDALVKETVGDARGKTAVDLYAGVGLFSLALGARFEEVQAVERGGPAYRDLETNAEATGGTVHARKDSAEDFLGRMETAPELMIADPPRAGLGKDATRELLRVRPAKLKIVSCDPSTMARDVKKLLDAYRIERIALVDLFPQTYHFETVVHLAKHENG